MEEDFDINRLRMKTLNIAIPEYIYDQLYKRGLIRKVNEVVVNHLIDVLERWDDNRDRDNKNCKNGEVPELEGMRTRKQFN